jgi:hypothetical protein
MPKLFQAAGESRSGWTLLLLFLATVQLVIFWMAGYSEGPLADKAVRYYSAARLFARESRVSPLNGAEQAWLNKLSFEQDARLRPRLHTYAVSPVFSAVLRSLCSAWPGAMPPYSYSIPVKVSSLLLFLFALGWLLLMTGAYPVDGVLAAACLIMAALGLSLPLLAPAAGRDMDFMAATPQGSAALLVLASFACFTRSRGVLAAASLLLAAGWHAGFAAIAGPCAAGAFGVSLCNRAGSREIRIIAAILTLALALLCVHLRPGPLLQHPVWIPAALVILFLLTGPATPDPAWRATSSLAAFLFLSLGADLALGHPPLREALLHLGVKPLFLDAAPLAGVRHLASLALAVSVLIGLLDRMRPFRLVPKDRLNALMAAATFGLAVAIASGMRQWPRAGHNFAIILHAEEGLQARPLPGTAALPMLNPKQEAAFFAALGDYLLTPPRP